jgi:prophage DNA circulation protein
MMEKIDTNQIPDFMEKPLSQQPDSAKAAQNNKVDASLQVDYASLIEKAKQAPETDAKAVQQARELLLSGQLESPENIRAAAENIIKFGV